MATLIISCENMKDVMKTFNSLENSCLLIKNITKTIENEIIVRIGGKTIGPRQDL